MSGPATGSAPGGALSTRRRRIALLLLVIPVVLAVASYLWLAFDRGTALLWTVPVHESGRFTLAGTVFYLEHFLREIPVDVAYALFLIAALARSVGGAAGPDRLPPARPAPTGRFGWIALALAALLVAGAVAATAGRGGWDAVWTELLQYRTRPEILDPGSHWRYHWLSTLWFGVAAHLLVPFVLDAALPGTAPSPGPRRGSTSSDGGTGVPLAGAIGADGWIFLSWGYFVVLTLVFGVSSEVFVDLRYVGHQAREIATHGLVTLPLALGAVLATGCSGGVPTPAEPGQHGSGGRRIRWTLAVPFAGIPAYLGVVALSGNVMSAGQTGEGLAAMVAGHLFEHTLDYLFVTLLTASGCAWMSHRLPARPE